MNRFLEVCSVQLLNFLSAYSFATGHPENRIVIKKQIIIDKCNMKMKPFASTLNSASFESATSNCFKIQHYLEPISLSALVS